MLRDKARRALRKKQYSLIPKLAPDNGKKRLNVTVSLVPMRRRCGWSRGKRGFPRGYYPDNLKENGSQPSIARSKNLDGKRFIVRANETLTAFMEFEAVIAPLNRNQIVFLSPLAERNKSSLPYHTR
jgi:hypothetical protein